MNKKAVLIWGIAVIVALLGVWLTGQPATLGSMRREAASAQTCTSDITFSLQAGQRIRFTFSSDVQSGELELVLYDSDGTMVFVLDHARELVTDYTAERDDAYVLAAECVDFVGEFKVSVQEAD